MSLAPLPIGDPSFPVKTGPVKGITLRGRTALARAATEESLRHVTPTLQADRFIIRAQAFTATEKYAPESIEDLLAAFAEQPTLLTENIDYAHDGYAILDGTLAGLMRQRLRYWMTDRIVEDLTTEEPGVAV